MAMSVSTNSPSSSASCDSGIDLRGPPGLPRDDIGAVVGLARQEDTERPRIVPDERDQRRHLAGRHGRKPAGRGDDLCAVADGSMAGGLGDHAPIVGESAITACGLATEKQTLPSAAVMRTGVSCRLSAAIETTANAACRPAAGALNLIVVHLGAVPLCLLEAQEIDMTALADKSQAGVEPVRVIDADGTTACGGYRQEQDHKPRVDRHQRRPS
jgi:hypothetical protein